VSPLTELADADANVEYRVVANDEEQYSIWPLDLNLPDGWREAGPTGPKQACLDYIDTVWQDMRPRSLREQMRRWQSEDTDEHAT